MKVTALAVVAVVLLAGGADAATRHPARHATQHAAATRDATPHAYVLLGEARTYQAEFLDRADLKRTGGDVAFSVLYVTSFPPGPRDAGPPGPHARTAHFEASCDWRAYLRAELRPGVIGANPFFAWSSSDLDLALTAACDAAAPAGPVFASQAAAIGSVRERIKPPALVPGVPPPLPIRPVERRGTPPFEAAGAERRFARLDTPGATGAVRFIDWRSRWRTADFGQAETLTVLGPGAMAEEPTVMLQSFSFNCANHTLSSDGAMMWDPDGRARGRLRSDPASAAPRPESPDRAVLDALCANRDPHDGFGSIIEAVNSARADWGEPPVVRPPEALVAPIPMPPVVARPLRPGEHFVTSPDWLRKPTGDDVSRYYPDQAQRQSVSGRATISCQVTAEGTLADCVVVSEDPEGFGFGDAAVHMAQLFKMRPQTNDGEPVAGATIRIPIRFMIPEPEPPPVPAPAP